MMRTHRAGDLRTEHVGDEVVVCGWVAHRRDHGGVVFLDMRDTAGLVQVVVDPEQAGCNDAHRVRHEWVLRVTGAVRLKLFKGDCRVVGRKSPFALYEPAAAAPATTATT